MLFPVHFFSIPKSVTCGGGSSQSKPLHEIPDRTHLLTDRQSKLWQTCTGSSHVISWSFQSFLTAPLHLSDIRWCSQVKHYCALVIGAYLKEILEWRTRLVLCIIEVVAVWFIGSSKYQDSRCCLIHWFFRIPSKYYWVLSFRVCFVSRLLGHVVPAFLSHQLQFAWWYSGHVWHIYCSWKHGRVRLMLSDMIQVVLKSSSIKFVFISDEPSRKMS
jgi:hypothetical protein